MVYKGPKRRRFVRFGYPFFIQYKAAEKVSEEEPLTSISSGIEKILKRWDEKGYDKDRLYSSLVEKMEDISFTKNISEGGICFVTKERFKPDTQLRVQIYTPTRKEPIKALVKVAWTNKRMLRSGYDTGVSFIEMAESDKRDLSNCLRLFSQIKLEELT
ncbi:MAG: PilZ domain-containing protein [Candidatus Omnitrophica bacterium]|nr:PilZ domain-containing protein [Candidatus Omnitrophota bacterium]